MANVVMSKNASTVGPWNGARTAYDMHSPADDENQLLIRAASVTSESNARPPNTGRSAAPPTSTSRNPSNGHLSKRVNGNAVAPSDEDIPENMYRPEKDHPEGWIHRDKLAKIESEELQAAGINLANRRSRSQSKLRSEKSVRDADGKGEDKRRRLQSPAEIEDEIEQSDWDFRRPEEIEAEAEAEAETDATSAASQMYANPMLRKSGSKIPVMTSSPLPIPAERYERDTPIARKRTASGTMSFDGDLSVAKIRSAVNMSPDSSDAASSPVPSSKQDSPQKLRSKSGTLSPTPTLGSKKTPAPVTAPAPASATATTRKPSGPPQLSSSPSQRPGTRSGEQDKPRAPINRPEGDPPWLATMYKPDPRLPPDQQLIPTLAKKQQQAQWAQDGAVPKTYDRKFTPIEVHNEQDLARDSARPVRTPSPIKDRHYEGTSFDSSTFALKPIDIVRRNSGRPGTSGSITGSYSTMPKVSTAPTREKGPTITPGPVSGPGSRSTNATAPTRMRAHSLSADEDDKVKKGCGCCVVM